MRELEFLPEWYPQLRRRWRLVGLQGWMTLAIVIGLALWLVLARRNLHNAEVASGAMDTQMRQTRTEEAQLKELLGLKRQLTQKEQVIAQLGFPVEMSRLLQTFDAVMPREMSLLEMSCTTEEVIPHTASSATAAQAKQDKNRPVQRRLRVRLVGVAPTDVDLANFLTGLSQYPCFESVALVRADSVPDRGHVTREFEVTLLINLEAAGQ